MQPLVDSLEPRQAEPAQEPLEFVDAARSIATTLGTEEMLPIYEHSVPAWVYLDQNLFIGAAKHSTQTWIGIRVPNPQTGEAWSAVLDFSALSTVEWFEPELGPLPDSKAWTAYLKAKLQELEAPTFEVSHAAKQFLFHLTGETTSPSQVMRQLHDLSRNLHTRSTARYCLQLLQQLIIFDVELMETILEAIDADEIT